MKKIAIILLSIITVSCAENTEIPKELTDDNQIIIDSLIKENLINSRQLNSKDSVVNSYALYINEIRSNLAKIKKQELLIIDEKSGTENLSIENLDLVGEIEIIGNLMLENSKLINKLKESLSKSESELNEFDKMILSLSEEVQIKNMEIYHLQEELENMDASLGMLFESYNQKVSELEDVIDEMNTAYFVVGNKKELLENSIITKEGGFIGIGKSNVLKDDFNKSYFELVKIDEFIELQLGVKSMDIITPHPNSSYKLDETDEMINKIIITNASEFWSNSKYLVILVK